MFAKVTRTLTKFSLLCYLTFVTGLSLRNGEGREANSGTFHVEKASEPNKIDDVTQQLITIGSLAKKTHLQKPKLHVSHIAGAQSRRCLPTEFRCSSGRCTPQSWRCDGDDDCHDESDEIGCPSHIFTGCGSNNCTNTRFQCNNGHWVKRNYVCDGQNDCTDGSDEYDCLNRNCSSLMFKCPNGQCVRHDPERNCRDNSASETANVAANLKYFQCDNGHRINKNFVCDGDRDCSDASDEYDCLNYPCPPSSLKCTNSGFCLPLLWRCDSHDDCGDDTDEIGCPPELYAGCGSNNCTTSRFQCNNGQWVDRNHMCDGFKYCSDGSDEDDCLNRRCPATTVRCADTGLCLSKWSRCNDIVTVVTTSRNSDVTGRPPASHSTTAQSLSEITSV